MYESKYKNKHKSRWAKAIADSAAAINKDMRAAFGTPICERPDVQRAQAARNEQLRCLIDPVNSFSRAQNVQWPPSPYTGWIRPFG